MSQQPSADKELSVYSSKARESLAKQHSIVELVFHESLATKKLKKRTQSKKQSAVDSAKHALKASQEG